MERMILVSSFMFGLFALFVAPQVFADIYKFTDGHGVMHFHNIANYGDPRYTLWRHERRVRAVVSADGHAHMLTGHFNLGVISPENRKRFSPLIATAAKRYRVDETLLQAMIMAESGYNPNAVSIKGAVGLMQLMPETARRYGVYHIADPTENIHGGTRYISYLLKLFNNNLRLAVAAYNAGEQAVINYGYTIPPYEETINYVDKVLSFHAQLQEKRALEHPLLASEP